MKLLCKHEWVVQDMYDGGNFRAYYHIECIKCNTTREGHYDEIPTARFKYESNK